MNSSPGFYSPVTNSTDSLTFISSSAFKKATILFMHFFLYPFITGYILIQDLREYFRYPLIFFIDLYLFFYYNFYFSNSSIKYEREKISKKYNIYDGNLTYGETPYSTIRNIMSNIPVKKDCLFIDTGCGRGRLSFYVSGVLNCKVLGIDIIPTYIKVAELIKEKLKIDNISFLNKSFDEVDISMADIVYVSGTCFDEKTKILFFDKLQETKRGAYIISVTYPIPYEGFKLIKEFKDIFSWGRGHVFIQQRC
ncbi:MAG: methyltransferase domain-containing protein [bacterium]|nr:methyltransferase domain-containing protein [bacterium]